MGFKSDGEQYFTSVSHTLKKNKIWPDIVANSDKIVHLLDMCGHQKYLKTTTHGLTSLFPDYVLLIVGANMGVSKMTREHLQIARALDLPLIVLLTKIDLAPAHIYKENLQTIGKILKEFCGKVPILVKTESDISKIAGKMLTGKICPIFSISNQTGEGIPQLRKFIGSLEKPVLAKVDEKKGINT